MKLGFIGLGSMGGRQAQELAKLPHELTVYDVYPPALKAFEGRANLAASMADVGRDADVVGVCVRDDAQVNECVDALIPVMKPNSVLLIHSTVRPGTVIKIAARAAERQIHVLDASVSRTEMGDDGPFVFCMTGGDEQIAKRVQPVLDAFSTDTIYVGPQGSAMALKISNNLVSWSSIMISLEAVRIAEAAGVPLDKLLTVMKRNGVMTLPAQSFVKFREVIKEPGNAEFIESQAKIGVKDLLLAQELAQETGTPCDVTTFMQGNVYDTVCSIFK